MTRRRGRVAHWNKLAAGKAVERRALPPARSGMVDPISIVAIPPTRAAEPAVEKELAAARDRTKAPQVFDTIADVTNWTYRDR